MEIVLNKKIKKDINILYEKEKLKDINNNYKCGDILQNVNEGDVYHTNYLGYLSSC